MAEYRLEYWSDVGSQWMPLKPFRTRKESEECIKKYFSNSPIRLYKNGKIVLERRTEKAGFIPTGILLGKRRPNEPMEKFAGRAKEFEEKKTELEKTGYETKILEDLFCFGLKKRKKGSVK